MSEKALQRKSIHKLLAGHSDRGKTHGDLTSFLGVPGAAKRRSKANLAPQGCSKRRSRANLAPQDCSKRRSRANFHALWPPKMPFQDHHNVYFSEADPKLLQMQPNCSAHIIFDSIKLIQNFCKCYQTAALTKRHCRWISTGAL